MARKATLGSELAEWAFALGPGGIPESVLSDGKLRVLDTLASAIAAMGGALAKSVRSGMLASGDGTGARIVGFGDRTAPAWAAAANGTMAHALDFDDTHPLASIHVSAPVVATALALGEAHRANGAAMLTAVIAGSELTARIGAVAPGAFQARGLHPTGIVGTIGAAITAGKMLGLTVGELQSAIGIAASQASGISESFGDGTWPRRLHPGWAAHCGIVAAILARSGFSGPATALDGRFGLFKAFLGSAEQPYERITEGLGETWIAPLGAFKPYPCGHVTHGFIDATLALRCEHSLTPDAIKTITCNASAYMIPLVCEPRDAKVRPHSESEAKGSLYYNVAAALLFGKLDGSAYEESQYDNTQLLALIDKIQCQPDPNEPKTKQYKGWVIVETTDGRHLEKIVEHSRGSHENPMTAEDIGNKARTIVAPFLPEERVAALIDASRRLEELSDIGRLVDHCCRPPSN